MDKLVHLFSSEPLPSAVPAGMVSPYRLPPHPLAEAAAAAALTDWRTYMSSHPESELHRQGKMCGVLVVRTSDGRTGYLQAFSARLDGQAEREGYVPPLYRGAMPVGHDKAHSQRLQRLFFAEQRVVNRQGAYKNLLDIFAHEKPIRSREEWFAPSRVSTVSNPLPMPPSGAGECCAPKLLQYALTQGLTPLALAEFWVGAPSRSEVRREGTFYAPCSGRCKPILRWILGEKPDEKSPMQGEDLRIDVLYEDEWLMVVNKPAGLLSVPGKGDGPSVESCFASVKAVHRLDQDTSGLLVLAKIPEVYKELQAYFQRRDILKRYEAVVKEVTSEGVKELRSEGEIRLPLLPNPYDRPRQMVDREHGKPAVTRYVIRERRPDGTLFVDFYPQTGRTHQLRVHAAHPDGLNAPILGDRLYGSAPLSDLMAHRLLLHAAEIRFLHPITKKEMHFCLPSSF